MTISNAIVDAALRAEDIKGLTALGAPGDEYAPEVNEIVLGVSALKDDQFTEANIVAVVALVWAKYFGLSSQEIAKRMHAFRQVAIRLL